MNHPHEGNRIITLVSKQVPSWSHSTHEQYLSMSTYVTTSLKERPNSTVLVVDLSPAALTAIIRYCEHHGGVEPRLIEPPLRSRRMQEVCEHLWDAEFIEGIAADSQTLLFDIAVGALYLQLQSLVHLACARLASSIKSHPLDKVKTILLGSEPNQTGSAMLSQDQLLAQQQALLNHEKAKAGHSHHM